MYSSAEPREQVFQVLLLDSENTGPDSNSLRDARNLTITKEQYQAFLDRHARQTSLVPEDNDAMKDSYLLIDEKMWYAVHFCDLCNFKMIIAVFQFLGLPQRRQESG